MSLPDLHGWLPVAIAGQGTDARVDWCRWAGRRFTQSFFESTVQEALREPFNQLFRHRLPLDSLIEWQAASPGRAPAGFIFHMSRCGSTLVAQMLAALPEHRVLSEPPPLDELLRMDQSGATDKQRIGWLRAWASAMAQPSDGGQQVFIKLDAWHIHEFPLLHQAFPETPWVFLYRNPVEVMVSALKSPGRHHVPGWIRGAPGPGTDPGERPTGSHAEFIAHSLAALLKAALQHLGSRGGRAIDYQFLPDAVGTDLARHFGRQFSAEQLAKMNAVTQFQAKSPAFDFLPDSSAKQQAASAEIRQLCAAQLDPLYQQLSRHTGQPSDGPPSGSSPTD